MYGEFYLLKHRHQVQGNISKCHSAEKLHMKIAWNGGKSILSYPILSYQAHYMISLSAYIYTPQQVEKDDKQNTRLLNRKN